MSASQTIHLCDVLVHHRLKHVQLVVQLDAVFREGFVSLKKKKTAGGERGEEAGGGKKIQKRELYSSVQPQYI